MIFESHFKSSFGNVKAFNLKKIKIIADSSPSGAAMAEGGPAAGPRGAMALAVSLRFLQVRQSRLVRTVFGLNPAIPFQKPLEVQ